MSVCKRDRLCMHYSKQGRMQSNIERLWDCGRNHRSNDSIEKSEMPDIGHSTRKHTFYQHLKNPPNGIA